MISVKEERDIQYSTAATVPVILIIVLSLKSKKRSETQTVRKTHVNNHTSSNHIETVITPGMLRKLSFTLWLITVTTVTHLITRLEHRLLRQEWFIPTTCSLRTVLRNVIPWFLSLRKIRQSLNPKFIVLVEQFYETLTDSRRTMSSFSGLSTLSVFILTVCPIIKHI